MNTSVIRYRVADFLKAYAPFDSLAEADLLALAAKGRVKFHQTDEIIFRQAQPKTPWIWVIQQGRVDLLDERDRLRDVLGEGDLLGLERFHGEGAYLHTARTASDVILYAIDALAFEELTARYPSVKRFLAAHFSVTGTGASRGSWLDAEAPTLEFLRVRARPSCTPLPALAAPVTTRQAIREMIRSRSEALSVTVGGKPAAVLTAADLALFCDRNPPFLLREIRGAASVAELAPLLKQASRMVVDALAHSSATDDCAHIATELVAAAAAACIRLAQQDATAAGMEIPAVRYCWVAFGTLARGEVLHLAPPKIGVVYDDTAAEASAYFAVVAGQLAAWFDACGLEGLGGVWPEGSHPCMPLSEWKRFFKETIRRPYEHQLSTRREFFDMRELSGDATLLGELNGYIDGELARTGILIPFLANDTLSNLPPLTFFHGVVLEDDGAQHDTLDLTEIVLNPISDAARVFALARRNPQVNTLERLSSAADSGNEAIFRDAAEAFRVALYHRTVAGSPLIRPASLSKLEQRVLKTAFSSIARLLELTTTTFAAAS